MGVGVGVAAGVGVAVGAVVGVAEGVAGGGWRVAVPRCVGEGWGEGALTRALLWGEAQAARDRSRAARNRDVRRDMARILGGEYSVAGGWGKGIPFA